MCKEDIEELKRRIEDAEEAANKLRQRLHESRLKTTQRRRIEELGYTPDVDNLNEWFVGVLEDAHRLQQLLPETIEDLVNTRYRLEDALHVIIPGRGQS